MRKLLICIAVLTGQLSANSFANAAIVAFYGNRATFQSALISSTTIDFEGLVDDGPFSFLTPFETTRVFNGVTFTASFAEPTNGTPLLSVSPKNSFLGPFNSALLFHDGAGPITADLTTAGTGFTAVGGSFGDLGHLGRNTTLTLTGSSGVLDVRTLVDADFQLGHMPSFFGWIVQGDTIVSIKHNSEAVEAIDNFVFGVAGDNLPPDGPPDGSLGSDAVPEPASLALWTSLGLAAGWRRRRTQAAPYRMIASNVIQPLPTATLTLITSTNRCRSPSPLSAADLARSAGVNRRTCQPFHRLAFPGVPTASHGRSGSVPTS